MKKDYETIKLEKFEEIYSMHVDKIYRICLYYLRDEKRAGDITVGAFVNYYKKFDGRNYDDAFDCLVDEVKKLILKEMKKK